MVKSNKKQHIIGLVMLSLTAMFWGAGFVLNAQLMESTFYDTPSLFLSVRFTVAALCLLVVFNKKLRFNKFILLYGGVGGAMLFVGFLIQTIGLKYTTPSHSGFFTASYAMFVPFIAWLFYKKRPNWISFVGVAVAIAGLAILNFKSNETNQDKMWLGDILTALSAVMFAAQIFWTDHSLQKGKIDFVQLTFWQVSFAALLFVLYSVSVESRSYVDLQFNLGQDWWRLLIVIFGGTAFAYYAQTYSQIHISATETSLIMACESPIGAFLSMILLIEPFRWQTIVGGLLVIVAVIIVEVVPTIQFKHKKCSCSDTCKPDDETPDSNEQNTE